MRRRRHHLALILIIWGYNHRHRLHLAHHNHPRLVLPVDQALGPPGGHHRVSNRVDLDSAHNKVRLPEDHLEELSSSKDQQEGLRRDHNLVREGVHRRDPSRVAQEDRGLNSPHKDLWVGHNLHREGQADLVAHPPEVRAHLNGQNKTSRP